LQQKKYQFRLRVEIDMLKEDTSKLFCNDNTAEQKLDYSGFCEICHRISPEFGDGVQTKIDLMLKNG